MRHLLYISLLATLLLAACGPSYDDMRRQLDQLAADNRADSLLTNDSLARTLADYFDRHGTANERMMAHYLLGRTYYDRGDAPLAVQSYQNAIEAADTTRADCDYHTLSRVYGQLAITLFYQCLYQDQLLCLDHAVSYAHLANDTLAALLLYGQKQWPYEMLGRQDSMLIICEEVSAQLRQIGHPHEAASFLSSSVDYLLSLGDTVKAHRYLDTYERESGYFDRNNEIEAGRELYYYVKGNYFTAIHQYDSAEYYYRKELRLGSDFNNQNSAAQGLSKLFMQTHRSDSAAKYALYAYDMNDSLYAQKATEETSRFRALYNYSTYQRQANEQQEQAHRNWRFLMFAIVSIIVLLIVTIVIVLKYQSSKKQYLQLVSRHAQTEKELATLREHQTRFSNLVDNTTTSTAKPLSAPLDYERLKQSEQMLNRMIEEKETELNHLNIQLAKFKQQANQVTQKAAEELDFLFKQDFYQSVIGATNNGRSLHADDWKAVNEFMHKRLPDFYHFITDKRTMLTDYEFQTSLLIRLHIKPKNIANALGLDGSYVTRVRKSLFKKLFGISGSSKDLDVQIRQIGNFLDEV